MFGESIPKEITSRHSGINSEDRLDMFKDYMKRKSTEKPADVLKTTISAAMAGGLAGHAMDGTKEALKKKLLTIVSSNPNSIVSKAQRMALDILGDTPVIRKYTKTKLIAMLAGIGAVYGFNRSMTSAREQDRAKSIKGNTKKLRRELAIRLSEAG